MRRRRDGDTTQSVLAEECEAVLAGTYVGLLEARNRPIPAWAWMNHLAHATQAELSDTARHPAPNDTWHRARSLLAGEMLVTAERTGAAVEDLQREVLIPLELQLMSWPDADLRPGELVTAIVTVLAEIDQQHDHERRARRNPPDR